MIRTGEQPVPERAECHVEYVVGFAVELAPRLQVNEPLMVSDPGRAKDAVAECSCSGLILFNLLFGARLSVLQACALIMVAITVTAVLTFAFAPISLFFLITARSYAFFKLLNVAILALTALVGLRFLTSGMRALNKQVVGESMVSSQVVVTADVSRRELVSATVGGAANPAAQQPTNGDARTARQNQNAAKAKAPQPAAGDRPASMLLLYIWILLFGFVGTQLAWTLRPFFGDPGQPFELFRDINGTFYSDILSTLGSLLG